MPSTKFTKPSRRLIKLVFLIVIITGLIALSKYITPTFTTIKLEPEAWQNTVMNEFLPLNNVRVCIQEQLLNTSFFTNAKKLREHINSCAFEGKLDYTLDKIPPDTLWIRFTPAPRPLYRYIQQNTNSYGLVVQQGKHVRVINLGKPYPEHFKTAEYEVPLVIYNTYPNEVMYEEALTRIVQELTKLPEFSKITITVERNYNTPPTLRITTSEFEILLDPEQDITDLEVDLNSALTVYEYLKKTGKDFTYIDTRFDRITVK